MSDEETSPRDTTEDVNFWLKELDAAKKREEDYRKDGKRILDLYDGTLAKSTPFNILYSNTETMLPALYSQTPRPVVQRRFKDEDPLGKAAAQAGQRMLEHLVDTDVDGYQPFDLSMTMATSTALLPGRATTMVKYDANEAGEHEYQAETVCTESVPWNRVLYGYAVCWEKVPWIAYEMQIDQREAIRLFDTKIASLLTFQDTDAHLDSGDTKADRQEPDQGERKVTTIHQIWDKDGGKKVRYISEQVKDQFLKVQDDPLGLTGFFNSPRPLMFLFKPHTLLPTALYTLYESQAEELNGLTIRIKKLIKAIKARGLYDGELGEEFKKLLEADETELVPTDRGSSLATEKGMDKALWMWPVQDLILVLTQLYTAREACKQVIYEITGISDILRGSTKASETLGAQEIKTQWGTLRLKKSQKAVASYAVDLLRMMLEIAAKKFSEETWAKMTGLPFILSQKWNELTALAETLQKELSLRPAMSPQQPGPPDPRMVQLQQIQQQLQAPKWEDVLKLLKDDLQRSYRIDIETNSTVEPEAAEDQKLLNEVMTTLSQVLAQMGPLVVKGVLPFQAAQTLLLTIVRRFRFGAELEDTIKAMQPPPPEDNGMKEQMAKLQAESQQKDMQMQLMEAQKQIREQQIDLQLKEIQLQADRDALAREKAAQDAQFALKQQIQAAEVGPEALMMKQREWQADRDTERMKANINRETELEKVRLQTAAQLEVARISAEAKAKQPKAVPA